MKVGLKEPVFVQIPVPINPFKHVYTGIDKTKKRAVSLDVIREIRDLKLTKKSLVFARDIFLFSFYTRGMSFVDMAFLKKQDLQNGILAYRRNKTGQQLFIKREKTMQELIDKYDTFDTPYLLPVIRNNGVDQWHRAMHGPVLPKVKMSLYLSSVKHWDIIRNKPPEFILAL